VRRLVLVVVLVVAGSVFTPVGAASSPPLHYIGNLHGQAAQAATVGYDLFDVGPYVSSLDALPEGSKALVWIGNGYRKRCSWDKTDTQVVSYVTALRGHPKLFGYYVADEPHTSLCADAAERVRARHDLVKSVDPAAVTFVTVEDGSSHPGEFQAFADVVDLIGVVSYPCNVTKPACVLSKIRDKADEALRFIPAERLVPVFQTFGQACASSNYYRLPTAAELQAILDTWATKIPAPVFDYSYTWGNQSSSCPTLVDSPKLQQVMAQHNA